MEYKPKYSEIEAVSSSKGTLVQKYEQEYEVHSKIIKIKIVKNRVTY